MSRDFRRLKREADILEVLYALGYSEGGDGPKSIKRMGANYFIHCPVPTHNDAHMSCRCKKGWPNLLCESCRESTYGIDLIMYETGASELEAADRLWEIEGRPDWYKSSGKKGENRFTLSWREQNLIGFYLPTDMEIPEKIESSKPKELGKDEMVNPYYSYYDNTMEYHYVVSRRRTVTMNDFLQENSFIVMARNKAIKKKEGMLSAYYTATKEAEIASDTEKKLWTAEIESLKKDLTDIQTIIDRTTLYLKKSQSK